MSKLTKKAKLIIIISISVFAVLVIGCGLYVWLNLSRMYETLNADPNATVSDDADEADAQASPLPTLSFDEDISVEPAEKPTGTVDILLLGVDNRNNGFTGRSDTMIYMRVDMSNSKIKMVSLMRDTLVKMEGHPSNRLNTAFRFGSIDLLKSTLKDNFGLTPDYYIVVNFYGMEDIIDALGGVEIDIKSNELSDMNSSIKEVNALDNDNKAPYVEQSGLQKLNGRQAVAYMRIRHVGSSGDAGRIERQQTVLSALFDKAKSISLEEIPGLINTISQYVRTDIPVSEMLKLSNTVKGLNVDKLETFRYPDQYYCGSYNDIPSVVKPKNLKDELAKLDEFLGK